MDYKHFSPVPALSPYIDSFWIIQSTAASAVNHRARMPADSRATLLLNFAGSSRMIAGDGATYSLGRGADLLGMHSQSYVLEHEGDTDLIAAQFRPGGFAAFVRQGIGELAEQVAPLDVLWGRPGSQLCEQIYEAATTAEKLALYQTALLKHLVEVPYQPRLQNALRQIDQAQGNVSVKWLAEQANLSQKQFERLFEHMVGMMPKRYLRLRRFQRLVSWLQHCGNAVNWTDLAAQFNYYDHSHLVKDFRTFAGTTPSEFAAATAGVVEVVYGQAGESQNV